jgi:hypothetical protein
MDAHGLIKDTTLDAVTQAEERRRTDVIWGKLIFRAGL